MIELNRFEMDFLHDLLQKEIDQIIGAAELIGFSEERAAEKEILETLHDRLTEALVLINFKGEKMRDA